jgi:hypothetical protein
MLIFAATVAPNVTHHCAIGGIFAASPRTGVPLAAGWFMRGKSLAPLIKNIDVDLRLRSLGD